MPVMLPLTDKQAPLGLQRPDRRLGRWRCANGVLLQHSHPQVLLRWPRMLRIANFLPIQGLLHTLQPLALHT
jgi:hypothetical protein